MTIAADKCALVMAGGTGGHIFPGLAVAHALRDKGWRVHWFGGTGGVFPRDYRNFRVWPERLNMISALLW